MVCLFTGGKILDDFSLVFINDFGAKINVYDS